MLISYDQVKEEIKDKHASILLGNGFSKELMSKSDKKFTFDDGIVFNKLCEKIKPETKKIITASNSENIEAILNKLEFCKSVLQEMRADNLLVEKIENHISIIKQEFINSIIQIHPKKNTEIAPEIYESFVTFLSVYENIFTLNYDLLLYWVIMSDINGENKFGFSDGFAYENYAEYFKERRVYYIHGALHLYMKGKAIQKWCSKDHREDLLIEVILRNIDLANFPKYISHGSAAQKLLEIEEEKNYLNDVFERFKYINSSLVIFGASLNEADEHIIQAIKDNNNLNSIYIGIFDQDDRLKNIKDRLQKSKNGALKIKMFDSRTIFS